MIISQYIWSGSVWNKQSRENSSAFNPQVVLVFGERKKLKNPLYFDKLREKFPKANIVTGSTSGEILGKNVYDKTIVATAIQFEKTALKIEEFKNDSIEKSQECGVKISKVFDNPGLRGLFIISDGQLVNGTEFLTGINKILNGKVPVTGGLAGDAARFEETLVGLNHLPESGNIVVIGFYGQHIRIGHGSKGGWDSFGPVRTITKSNQNILYELDNKNALELYEEYLGDKAEELPGSALFFPLLLTDDIHPDGVVRTILGVDKKKGSMTFAGNVPEGATVQIMKANLDKLIDGSVTAARQSVDNGQFNGESPELSILISCVGRKLVLGQLTDEEVEEAIEVIGRKSYYTGFYSYGELSPTRGTNACHLHNQTMTITTFKEV